MSATLSSVFKNKSLRQIVPQCGERAVRQIYKANPNVCLVFTRDFNGNVVCLEARLNESKNQIESIFCYWLNLEESYRIKREASKKYEYEELKTLEKKMAFQFITLDSPPAQNIVMPSMPHIDCISSKFLYFTKFKNKKFLVQLELKKDDMCALNCCMYASTKENPLVFNIKVLNLHAIVAKKAGLPSVKKVIMHGFDIGTQQPVTEEFKN